MLTKEQKLYVLANIFRIPESEPEDMRHFFEECHSLLVKHVEDTEKPPTHKK